MGKNNNKSFIAKVSTLHGDRLHIEIPKPDRDKFEPGDTVRSEKIEMNYPAAELRSISTMRSLQIISAVFGKSAYRLFLGL